MMMMMTSTEKYLPWWLRCENRGCKTSSAVRETSCSATWWRPGSRFPRWSAPGDPLSPSAQKKSSRCQRLSYGSSTSLSMGGIGSLGRVWPSSGSICQNQMSRVEWRKWRLRNVRLPFGRDRRAPSCSWLRTRETFLSPFWCRSRLGRWNRAADPASRWNLNIQINTHIVSTRVVQENCGNKMARLRVVRRKMQRHKPREKEKWRRIKKVAENVHFRTHPSSSLSTPLYFK